MKIDLIEVDINTATKIYARVRELEKKRKMREVVKLNSTIKIAVFSARSIAYFFPIRVRCVAALTWPSRSTDPTQRPSVCVCVTRKLTQRRVRSSIRLRPSPLLLFVRKPSLSKNISEYSVVPSAVIVAHTLCVDCNGKSIGIDCIDFPQGKR